MATASVACRWSMTWVFIALPVRKFLGMYIWRLELKDFPAPLEGVCKILCSAFRTRCRLQYTSQSCSSAFTKYSRSRNTRANCLRRLLQTHCKQWMHRSSKSLIITVRAHINSSISVLYRFRQKALNMFHVLVYTTKLVSRIPSCSCSFERS